MATKPPPPTPRTTLMSEFIHKCVDDLAHRDGCLPPGEDLVRACTDAADLIYGGQ